MAMPRPLIIFFVLLVLGSWFLLGEKKSIREKAFVVLAVIVIYLGYRIMAGESLHQILLSIFGPQPTEVDPGYYNDLDYYRR
jgi:hypothetical protein